MKRMILSAQAWNPLTGQMEEVPDVVKSNKPSLLSDLKLSTSYTYDNGKLYRDSAKGKIIQEDKAYRRAGNYMIYLRSFPNAAYPYSRILIADAQSGDVYEGEMPHGFNNRRDISELVEYLKLNTL